MQKRQRKLEQKHIDFINDCISSKADKLYTWRDVRHDLELEHPEVKPVSDTTVRRWMKRDLSMSFKKLERKNPNTFTPGKIRSLFESEAIQLKLWELEVEQIFIDEFSVNARHSSFYGWSKRGEKRHLRLHSDNFLMSFVFALSSLAVYGVMGTNETTNAGWIEYFIREMLDWRNSHKDNASRPFVIVMDNATVHTSFGMGSFLKKAGVGAVTITPYSPALNPCEKVINAVKFFMKQKQATENKPLSLKMLQDSLDKLAKTPASKFVEASHIECCELMKKY